METKMNFNYTQLVQEIKSTFECKLHPNTKFNAYCSLCKLNICEKCLGDKSPHIGHQIFYFSKIILADKYIKYYQTLYFFCKYYLNCVKEIVIELLSDLSDINTKEKNLKLGLKSQLKSAYKIFHKINTYEMQYTKFVLSTYLNCKRFNYFNYQIIQNVYNIKLNSVRIPDLDDKDIINKVKTMIDFLRCSKNNNNILKTCHSDLPNTVYSYVDYNTLTNPKINIYSVKAPLVEKYIKKGEIYQPNIKEIKSDNETNEQQQQNEISTNSSKINENTENNIIYSTPYDKSKSKNDENNDNNIKTNEINDNKNDNKNENKIINNSINSEVNEEQKNDDKENSNNNNIKIKVVQSEDKKISTSPQKFSIMKTRAQFLEEFKSKSTPPFQGKVPPPQSNLKKSESKKNNSLFAHRANYELEEEIHNKFYGDISNQINNENIKKLIYKRLTKNCPEEVEYKDKIEYIYHDKVTNKDISCCYFGEFKKGTYIRHGKGLFIWKDGETYLGYWANDKREGEGTNTYANGNTYQGNYKNGKKEGLGEYRWKNGDFYSGYWKNDMKEGKGIYKFANGDVYDGMFKNDKINGEGTYTWANKIGYKGQFKNNTVEKDGILKYTVSKDNDEINIFKNKENIFTQHKSEINENFIEDEKDDENEDEIKNEK